VSRNKRCEIIREELLTLCEKINFPPQSERSVVRKVQTLTSKFDKFQKRPDGDAHTKLSEMFDITMLVDIG
jgi:hypothetical protein